MNTIDIAQRDAEDAQYLAELDQLNGPGLNFIEHMLIKYENHPSLISCYEGYKSQANATGGNLFERLHWVLAERTKQHIYLSSKGEDYDDILFFQKAALNKLLMELKDELGAREPWRLQ